MPNPATASSAAPAGGLRTLTATSRATGGSRPRMLLQDQLNRHVGAEAAEIDEVEGHQAERQQDEDREADAQADERLQIGAHE